MKKVCLSLFLLAPAFLVESSISSVQAAPQVALANLITKRSIGPARLGMTLGALKRAFPGATLAVEEGPVMSNTLSKNGREILRFTTREQQRDMTTRLFDSDRLSVISTSDPRFSTREGITPGSWLHNAIKVYGRPTLEFWNHGENASFKSKPNLSFEVTAPPNPKSDYRVAGIYSTQQLESGQGTTTRFRRGTRIVEIRIYE